MIYLDNSATTKPHPEVMDSFYQAATTFFGNPSSVHRLGMDTERLLRKARHQAASLLQVKDEEVFFTSGGTEGNNLAIKGIALQHQTRGKHLITTTIEHPSVLEAFRSLEELGFSVTYIQVDKNGTINIDQLKQALSQETILVSVMHVNNEIGTIQPIEEIASIVSAYPKAFLHVDHVQGFGKVHLPLNQLAIDLCTISGHKIHGLKGTGIMYKRKGVTLFPLSHGGGQEQSIRSGTENVPANVALVKAMRLIHEQMEQNKQRLEALKGRIIQKLQTMDQVVVNTPSPAAPHIVNFSLPGIKPEVMIHALEEDDIYISTKSACSSKSADESAVLAACGHRRKITESGLRISMSYETTEADIDYFLVKLAEAYDKLSKVMR
ncbi:cysteine desulfurase [Gracilibacillus halophilus YIM-C55.5]|uniref:Cysteine desulfurase n=1 Tax=Gracilibacillus halophilus YIM-C55.5 TaxID=1308866 RepID=N4WCG0_9BACI|nr:cysteine desulfurase family protein [Gracilibacillus halophilus]ENH96929.1 cysteine desulfurase [Gracilibacillus halophilus YIM-C55.5]